MQDSLEVQDNATMSDFKTRLEKAVLAFAEQGYNACLYWENQDISEFVSLVLSPHHNHCFQLMLVAFGR